MQLKNHVDVTIIVIITIIIIVIISITDNADQGIRKRCYKADVYIALYGFAMYAWQNWIQVIR